jgi:chromate transporter
MDLVTLFLISLRASLLSVGGATALPLLREDLVRVGFLTDEEVVASLTIGRLSTGPNGLFIVAMGYLAMGWVGAVATLLAATVPPLLMVPAAALLRPRLVQPRVAGIVRGIGLAAVGLLVATMIQLLGSFGEGGLPAPWQLALAAIGVGIGIRGRVNPIPFVLGAGAIGIVLVAMGG